METGQIPEGVDATEQDVRETELGEAAHALLTSLQDEDTGPQLSRNVRAFQTAWNRAGRSPRLVVDGVYGRDTLSALANATGQPTSQMPASHVQQRQTPPRTPPAPGTDATSTPAPEWLPVAVALAKWTQQARGSDTTANTRLSRLASNATWLASKTDSRTAGIAVGSVPPAPDDSSVQQWTDAAWQWAQRTGASAQRQLAQHAQQIITQAESALASIRTALDRETDTAIRQALTMLEATLTAILRPLARGIRASGLGTGLGMLIGAALLIWALK